MIKLKNKILWLLLFVPVCGFTQILGTSQGDNVEISSMVGATVSNNFWNKSWLYRAQNGSDWYSSRLHDGISIDASFLTPQLNTRTWWERDPYNNTQSWGDGGNTYLTINQGNVGIGTTTPSSQIELFHLTPKITLSPAGYSGNYKTSLGTQPGAQAFLIFGNNGQNEIRAGNTVAGGYLDFFTNNTVDQSVASDGNLAMRLAANGNVGIGTTLPREKLSVNGKIRAHEIKVEMANWPDYVFTKNYQLPTLQQTEQHIKEKGHLPGIPSAAEVKANGIELGDMNKRFLQKIEELTLYLIEMKKENGQQQKQLEKQGKLIQKILNRK